LFLRNSCPKTASHFSGIALKIHRQRDEPHVAVILPNIMPLTFTHTANQAGFAVVAYASLAFIGLGTNSATPDWGSMLFDYRLFIFDHPILMLMPGLAIAISVFILNLVFKKI